MMTVAWTDFHGVSEYQSDWVSNEFRLELSIAVSVRAIRTSELFDAQSSLSSLWEEQVSINSVS